MGAPLVEFLERMTAKVLETPVGKVASKFVVESAEHAVRRMGPIGEAYADLARMYETKFPQYAAKFKAARDIDLKGIRGDPARERMLYETLDKGTRFGDQAIDQAAANEVLRRNEQYTDAQSRGIKVGARVPGPYWPHTWPRGQFEGVNKIAAIRHLVATGQAATEAEAERILNFHKPGTGHAPNLEFPRRIKLPGYRTDLAVLDDVDYTNAKRIVRAQIFGPKDELFHQISDTIKKQGYDSDYVNLVHDVVFGRHAGMASGQLTRKIMSLEAAMKLGRAVIPHMGQSLHASLIAGIGPSMKTIAAMVRDYGSAEEFALKSGATYHDAMRQQWVDIGLESESIGEKVIKYSGLQPLMKFNKVLSSGIGRQSAIEEFARLQDNPELLSAKRRLLALGIDPESALKRGSLEEGDLLSAGKRMSDMSLLGTSALDIPIMWRTHPGWRMLFLYKQYGFKEARWVKDFVLKPALRGELRPLIFFATVFPLFGEITADLGQLVRKGTLKDRPGTDKLVDRYIEDVSRVGLLGIYEGAIYALASPSEHPLVSFALGPVFGEPFSVVPKLQAARIAYKKGNTKRAKEILGREALSRVPTFGPLLSRKIYPPAKRVRSATEKGEYTRMVERLLQ